MKEISAGRSAACLVPGLTVAHGPSPGENQIYEAANMCITRVTCKYGITNTPSVEATSISAYGCLMQNGVILHHGLLFSILLRERYQMKNEKIEKKRQKTDIFN